MEWYDLLAEKDFEELTPAEQQEVLKSGSQEDYQAQRQAILASQALWATEMAALTPAPPSKALQALQKKQPAPQEPTKTIPLWQQWANYSIPVWKVAAAALLLLCMRMVWPVGEYRSSPQILVQKDTVYIEHYTTQIEKVVQPADTIIQVIYKTIDTAATLIEPVLAGASSLYEHNNEEVALAQEQSSNIWESAASSGGQSLHQDTFLQQLTKEVASHAIFSSNTW